MSGSLEDMTVDQLLAHAKGLQSQASLLSALTSDPATRESVQRLLKQKFPTMSIPEIDAKDAVRAEIKTERDERLKLENKIREDEIRRRLTDQRRQVMSDHSLTEADMIEVEKLMTREIDPIPTYNGAALVYKASKQSATPTPSVWTAPTTYEMPEKDTWGPGIGNRAKLERIALSEANKAVAELFGGKVPGLGTNKAA